MVTQYSGKIPHNENKIHISEKVAEKFAKKINFSYNDAYNGLTTKQQKISLEGACRKYLKKYNKSENSIIEAVKDSPKKRKLSSNDSDGEENLSKSKRKVI